MGRTKRGQAQTIALAGPVARSYPPASTAQGPAQRCWRTWDTLSSSRPEFCDTSLGNLQTL